MKAKSPKLPDTIYLDTNMLMQLPYWSSNIDFIELRESAKSINCPILVPEVVAQELLQRRIETARDHYRALEVQCSSLGKLLKRDPISYEKIDMPEEKIILLTEDFLRHIGIQVVPTPENISIQELIDMAVKKEAPFQGLGEKGEKGDKGFKDTIILFTIIQHMKSCGLQHALFLTADNIFTDKHVIERITRESLHLEIEKNFKDGNNYLRSNLDALVRQHLEEESSRLIDFLDGKFMEICDFIVGNVSISEQFIKPTGLLAAFTQDHSLDCVSIKKIIDINPSRISNAYPGLLREDELKIEGAESITFSVSLQIDLIIEEYDFGYASSLSKRFPISEPEAYEAIRACQPSFQPKSREHTVYRDLTIDAHIYLKDGEYDRLKIDKIHVF
jgi:hypothetical protein